MADQPQLPLGDTPPPLASADPSVVPSPPAAAPPEPTPAVKLTSDEQAIGVTAADDRVVVPAQVYRTLIDHAEERGAREAETKHQLRLAALGFDSIEALIQASEDDAKSRAASPPPAQEIPVSDPAAPASPTPAGGAPAIAPAQPAAAPAPAPIQPAYQPPAAAVTPPPGQQPGSPAGAQPGQPDPNDRTLPEHIRRRMQQQQQRATQQYTTLQQQHAAEVAKAAALQQQVDALNEEMRLKLEMSKLGVTDLDFAWFEMSKHLKTLAADRTPEGQKRLAEFSPQAWAEEQRKTRPFIFGQMPVPAQTGAVGQPGSQPAPTAPTPAQVTGAAAGAGTFDARTSSPRDFEAHMRSLGINYVGSRPVRPQ